MVETDGLAAAGAGDLQAERMIAEAGNVEPGAAETGIPWDGESADAAAEAAAGIIEAWSDGGKEPEQGGGGAPEIGGGTTVRIRLPAGDAVEDVVAGVAGDMIVA